MQYNMMMSPFGFNANPLMQGQQPELFADEEYISEEEFIKGLTQQESTIFNALVISIQQVLRNNLIKFSKRRMEYLESMPQNQQQILQVPQMMNMLKNQMGMLDGQVYPFLGANAMYPMMATE